MELEGSSCPLSSLFSGEEALSFGGGGGGGGRIVAEEPGDEDVEDTIAAAATDGILNSLIESVL